MRKVLKFGALVIGLGLIVGGLSWMVMSAPDTMGRVILNACR